MGHKKKTKNLPPTPLGYLPPHIRVLFITGPQRTGQWLARAFAADSATDVMMEELEGAAAGMERLRDENFDAVLVSHEPGLMDALELLDAIRAGSRPYQPIIVLGQLPEQEMSVLCYESGADVYVCLENATTRALIWEVSRAVERGRLISENERFKHTQAHLLKLEAEEAKRLLAQQRAIVFGMSGSSETVAQDELPAELVEHYGEFLRAYVIMGSGRLDTETERLADLLVSTGISARQTIRLHLNVLEEMVQNLGARSARHVMNRADVLVLEVTMHLAERYQQRRRLPREMGRLTVPPGLDLAGVTRGTDSQSPS